MSTAGGRGVTKRQGFPTPVAGLPCYPATSRVCRPSGCGTSHWSSFPGQHKRSESKIASDGLLDILGLQWDPVGLEVPMDTDPSAATHPRLFAWWGCQLYSDLTQGLSGLPNSPQVVHDGSNSISSVRLRVHKHLGPFQTSRRHHRRKQNTKTPSETLGVREPRLRAQDLGSSCPESGAPMPPSNRLPFMAEGRSRPLSRPELWTTVYVDNGEAPTCRTPGNE